MYSFSDSVTVHSIWHNVKRSLIAWLLGVRRGRVFCEPRDEEKNKRDTKPEQLIWFFACVYYVLFCWTTLPKYWNEIYYDLREKDESVRAKHTSHFLNIQNWESSVRQKSQKQRGGYCSFAAQLWCCVRWCIFIGAGIKLPLRQISLCKYFLVDINLFGSNIRK